MNSPLDRIEAEARRHAEPENYCDLGDNGDPCVLCANSRHMAHDVLALVNVAKAAERQAQREPGSLDTAIREALAKLNKEPA